MSTEIARIRNATREQRGRRAYARSFGATVLVLVLAAGALGTANAVRGPVVRDAVVNTEAVIERTGQRLTIDTDQPIHPVTASHVRVTPHADVDVESDPSRITVRFSGLLRYGEEYLVEVDVEGTATGATSTLQHRFTTPSPDVYTLVRSPDGDRVLRGALDGSEEAAVVADGPHIQEYAVAGDFIVMIGTLDDGSDGIGLRAPGDSLTYPLPTPDAAGYRVLRAATSELLVGYLTDEGSAEGPLHLVDLEETTWTPRVVTGSSGEPLVVRDWLWVPGTTSLVAQDVDRQLHLVDALSDAAPQLIGTHTELRGFVPGTVQLVVADPTGPSLIDLATGEARALDLPPADIDPDLHPTGFLLTGPESSIEAYSDLLGPASAPRAVLFEVTAAGARELFRPATPSSRIGAICISPNGQFVATEVIPGGARSDNDPYAPGWEGSTTYYVDAATGESSRGLPGMASNWCD